MVYSIIQKSQLEGANRLDAEYYQPEYLKLKLLLEKVKSKKLSDIAEVSGGKRLPVGEIFSDQGVPYLRIVDIYNTFVDLDGVKYISEKLYNLLKRYQIKNADVLMTIVGNTVGLVGYNQTSLGKFNFTENCARIRSETTLPQYILAVLMSNIGQLQVVREKVGAAQPKLSLDRLRNFQIPTLNGKIQTYVRSIVLKALDFFEKSNNLYLEVEDLLSEELGLKDFKVEDDLSYVVNLSDVKSAHRADAEYFKPKYNTLISKVKVQMSKLGDLVSIKKGIEPGSEEYQDEGKLFIRVSSLSKNGIEDKDQKYLNDELYEKLKKDYEPKVGEILLTKDATPGIAYVLKGPVEGIISGGILRLKLKNDIGPEYLALCINSIIGQWQAERDAGGSVITHWKPEQIKNLFIPILPKPTQQKITDLVQKSHQASKKSKELLEEAKRKVEEMIEKGSGKT